MPTPNRFRHQRYAQECSTSDWRLVSPEPLMDLHADDAREVMAEAGKSLRDASIGTIYLVHGTLAGTDLTGLIGELGRIVPEWADQLRSQEKRLVDSLVGDWANYDEQFAHTLESGINAQLATPIEVRRYVWASENHHLGRADGAVGLIAELIDRAREAALGKRGDRVMLWGHSHAGNVFAIATNLLGGEVADRHAFFRAARSFYRSPGSGKIDVPEWDSVRQWLAQAGNPLQDHPLAIVTFGTPIRYGWDAGGYHQLLHLINHHPCPDRPPHCAAFPPSLEQLASAESGDMVQQVFIAGTNFPPNFLAWRSWLAERRLGKLLQHGLRRRNLWERLKVGMRVPDEGTTLLVDYAASGDMSARSMWGHAIYTKCEWLPFHLQQIVAHLEPRITAGRTTKRRGPLME